MRHAPYPHSLCNMLKKADTQTGRFGFARNMCQLFAKSKEPVFLPALALTNNETN